MAAMGFEADDRKRVARGTVWNLFGQAAGASQGIFLFLGNWLAGGEAFGVFVIAYSLIELLSRLFIGGFGDGIVFFTARFAPGSGEDGERQRKLRAYAAGCILLPLALSLLSALGLFLVSGFLYHRFWPGQPPELRTLLGALCWALPLSVLVRLPAEATRGFLEMRWAALVEDTLLPLLITGLFLIFHFGGMGPRALPACYLLAHVLCLGPAWWVFAKYFPIRDTLRTLPRAAEWRELLGFCLPQSVNMLFNFGMSRIDTLMLSLWLPPVHIARYALVAELARSIRYARTSFSTVFAPLVAKYKEAGNRTGIEESLGRISLWTSSLCIPILLVAMSFYPEVIMGPGHGWPESRLFPWLVCFGPVLSCFLGLAGNLLLMTGHTRFLLWNSSLAFGANVFLNWLLIPRLGLTGAALANLAASSFMTAHQVWAMGRYEGIRYHLSQFRGILGAGLAACALMAIVHIEWISRTLYTHGALTGVALKALLLCAALALFAAVLLRFPGYAGEREWFRSRARTLAARLF